MNVDYAAIHAEARRLRTEAVNQYVFAPIAALFHRVTRAEPRKAPAVFSAKGC